MTTDAWDVKGAVDRPALKVILIENTWLTRGGCLNLDFGWGNGYVDLPEGHPLFGVGYMDDDDNMMDICVHGGVTFAEEVEGKWRIGFDTAHCSDSLGRWPKEAVEAEAMELKKQLEEMW